MLKYALEIGHGTLMIENAQHRERLGTGCTAAILTVPDERLGYGAHRAQRRELLIVSSGSLCVINYEGALAAIDCDQESVCDILSDLQHFCLAESIDFEGCLAMARQHFEAER